MTPRKLLCAGAGTLALLFHPIQASASNVGTIDSQWSSTKVQVDGDLADWAGALAYQPDDDFTLGVRNDSEYVYVAIMLDNPRVGFRTLMNGLTVWFDLRGDADSTIGVRFPIAARELMPNAGEATDSEEIRPPSPNGEPRGPGGPGRGGAFRDPERLRALLDRASYELDLVDGKGRARRLGMDDAEASEGVSAAIGESKNVISCEFKIPLMAGKGHATAIGTGFGESFGLRIESEARRREDRPEGRGGFGEPGGGGFGGRGGRGGFDGGPNGGRMGPPPDGEGRGPAAPLEFKAKVVTAGVSKENPEHRRD